MTLLEEQALKTKEASYEYGLLTTDLKNRALKAMAEILRKNRQQIFRVNQQEVLHAKQLGRDEAFCDRLLINDRRFEEMVCGIEQVVSLDDPIGRIYDGRTLPSGLTLYKKTVPLGVVGVIYESRPNVTADIAALCLKSGNACMLRGGSEAFFTNRLLHSLLQEALSSCKINPAGISFVDSTDRAYITEFLQLSDYIDVIIPRGGEGLQRRCKAESSIPVITGGFGVSHIFVDESCNLRRAVPVVVNAKAQKPSACNAVDTLLIHEKAAAKFLSLLLPAFEKLGIFVVAHDKAFDLCQGYKFLEKGCKADFDREFLSLKLNVALVGDIKEVVKHLQDHHASHSDAILTDSMRNAQLFAASAGSACVYINASTRFSDGGQFGLGAEVAISTQKLHARGPMALEALTSYQYVCSGDYLARA